MLVALPAEDDPLIDGINADGFNQDAVITLPVICNPWFNFFIIQTAPLPVSRGGGPF